MSDTETSDSPPRPQLYPVVWRWHFYAGLLVVPVCILLGVTGVVYLFRPIAEPWLYRDLQQVVAESPGQQLLPEQQLQRAQAAFPKCSATAIRLGTSPGEATRVTLRSRQGARRYVYVNPWTGQITGSLLKDQMFMQVIKNLHGELLLGWLGSTIVELTSCWTIILVLTGWYLAWPRPQFHVAGILVPRLRLGGRLFWRDLHTVVGVYTSGILLALLLTGLPWTNVWGGTFKRLQHAVGQQRPVAAGFRVPWKSVPPEDGRPMSLSQAINLADQHDMPIGYEVQLPRGADGIYGFTHRAQQLQKSRYVYIDQYSGQVLGQADWDNHPVTAKAISLGIRLHQGELFGWTGFLLMLVGGLAAVWMAVTGSIMWWRRRPTGSWGAPPRPQLKKLPRTVRGVIVALAVFLPLAGASMLLIAFVDRYVMSRSR